VKIEENVVSIIGRKLSSKSIDYEAREYLIITISDSFDRSLRRIGSLADHAKRSAVYFKIMGVVLAVLGILAPLYEAYRFLVETRVQENLENWIHLINHIPHILPFILLSEVLAFVMFRYHSRSLEQLRYYANEVTTLDIRRAAAISVIKTAPLKEIRIFAEKMFITERNTILKKDERTIELGQNQGEDAYSQNLLKMATDIIKATNAKDGTSGGTGAKSGQH
jgi:hypothetical protein